MTPDGLNWPVVYSGGTALFYEPAIGLGSAYFGGPLDRTFDPPPRGPAPLHRVFTFRVGDVPKPEGWHLEGDFPLFFGMQYDGCILTYRLPVLNYELQGSTTIAGLIQDAKDVEILALQPKSSTHTWPYIGYPHVLPYIPFTQSRRQAMVSSDFESECTWQGLEGLAPHEMVVVIPACANLGVSMWGRSGDQERVQIIYRYNFQTHIVHGVTCCT